MIKAARLTLAGTVLALLSMSAVAQESDSMSVAFSIEQQPMLKALNAWAQQSRLQLIWPAGSDAGMQLSPKVVGRFPPRRALQMLLSGSSLQATMVDAQTVEIMLVARAGVQRIPWDKEEGVPQLVAQAGSDMQRVVPPLSEANTGVSKNSTDRKSVDEVVVTGTHIRGTQSLSPVLTFDRDEIERQGFTSVSQLMQALPQNFNAGVSETTRNLTNRTDASNASNGSAVNLRGLGNVSTLVLLDGRRLAPAGQGNYVDISMIPLSAIDRVEVMTDGASAIYGSDAVGGVVNFVMRKDYDGNETGLRYGGATQHGLSEFRVSQLLGTSWNNGHALVSYDYSDRDSLRSADRSFSQGVGLTELLPSQLQNSLLLSASQRVGKRTELFGNILYSKRKSAEVVALFPPTTDQRQDTEQYTSTIGGVIDISESWRGEIAGTISRNRVEAKNINVATGTHALGFSPESKGRSLELKADGAVAAIPGGVVKLAVGSQLRRENYFDAGLDVGPGLELDVSRDVKAAFTEMFIPLMGSENGVSGARRLELTLALRYERYSDFGSSRDPKYGVLWAPTSKVSFHSTYGTSFRAPLFTELDQRFALGFLGLAPNPASPTGTTLTVFQRGGNLSLTPETAKTWTAGVEFRPFDDHNLQLSANYFDIKYDGRIARVVAVFSAFTNPRFAALIDNNPDPSVLAFLGSQVNSRRVNVPATVPFTDALAIVDERQRNNGSTQIRGLDFDAKYSLQSSLGYFAFDVDGTYVIDYKDQILPSAEILDLADTYNYPVELRLRGITSWSLGELTTSLAINHVGSYLDNRRATAVRVASWNTADLSVSYETTSIGEHASWLDNMRLTLSSTNLLDRDPPFVAGNFGFSVNFDPNVANPYGRIIALQATKKW